MTKAGIPQGGWGREQQLKWTSVMRGSAFSLSSHTILSLFLKRFFPPSLRRLIAVHPRMSLAHQLGTLTSASLPQPYRATTIYYLCSFAHPSSSNSSGRSQTRGEAKALLWRKKEAYNRRELSEMCQRIALLFTPLTRTPLSSAKTNRCARFHSLCLHFLLSSFFTAEVTLLSSPFFSVPHSGHQHYLLLSNIKQTTYARFTSAEVTLLSSPFFSVPHSGHQHYLLLSNIKQTTYARFTSDAEYNWEGNRIEQFPFCSQTHVN